MLPIPGSPPEPGNPLIPGSPLEPGNPPMPGMLLIGKSFKNAAAVPPANAPPANPVLGLMGRVEGMPRPAYLPPVAGRSRKLGVDGLTLPVPTLGRRLTPGRVPTLGTAPLGKVATRPPPGRMPMPALGRMAGVGRLPYAGRRFGVRLANPLPLGRVNDDGRPEGLDIEGVRPTPPPYAPPPAPR
jgi:hypothetical protein